MKAKKGNVTHRKYRGIAPFFPITAMLLPVSDFPHQSVTPPGMGAVSVSYPFTLINAGSAAMLGVGSASVLSRAIEPVL